MKTEVNSSNDSIWTPNVALTQLSNGECFPIIEDCPAMLPMVNDKNQDFELSEAVNLNLTQNDFKIACNSSNEILGEFILLKDNVNVIHVDGKYVKGGQNWKRCEKNENFENILFFVCNLCSFLCTSDEKIDEHVEFEHKNKPFVKPLSLKCPVCPNVFFHKLSLRSHLIHDHKVGNTDLRRIVQASIYSSKMRLSKGSEMVPANVSCKKENDFKYIESLISSENEDATSNDASLDTLNKNTFDRISIVKDLGCKTIDKVSDLELPSEVLNIPLPALNIADNIATQLFENNTLIIKKRPDSLTKFLDQKKLQKCSIPTCKVRLQDLSKMAYHEKCHQGSSFKCMECSVLYSFWKPLSGHLWRVHKIDMELFACDKCDYKTFSAGKLNNIHKLIHSDVKSFKCDACDKGFKNSKQLRNHKLTHKDKGLKLSHNCEICSKSFSDRRQLRVHFNSVHKKIKPFLCSYCGYRAASKSALKMHIRHHTGEKPFACDSCNYTTGDHNSLRRHKLRHTGHKPYKCVHCDYACIQSSTYKMHLKTKHQGIERNLVFICEHCRFETVNQDMYLSHLCVVHKQKLT